MVGVALGNPPEPVGTERYVFGEHADTAVSELTTVRMDDDQHETITRIVDRSGETANIRVLGQSEVIRLLLDAGIAALHEGELELDGTELRTLLDDAE